MAGDIYGWTGFQAVSLQSNGVAVSPPLFFSSETSLGLYRSAASVLANSYGTFAASGLSAVGLASFGPTSFGTTSNLSSTFSGSITVANSAYTGTPIFAISGVTVVVPAHVVQPSASSFTVFVWPAVRAGDVIQCGLMPNPGVSSLSSGLIMHSHCTVNGQCELRYSNVSTLVQNQSAQTWVLVRMSIM